MAWGLAYTLAMGLQKCGDSSGPDQLDAALDGLGSYNVPGNAFPFGNMNMTSMVHNSLVSEQLYHWDPATSTASKFGPVVSFGAPNY